jgi:hypothetical protein
MKFHKKVGGTKETPVLVHYRKGSKVKGKLVNENGDHYYLREDGKVFPTVLGGDGQWIAVIIEDDLVYKQKK